MIHAQHVTPTGNIVLILSSDRCCCGHSTLSLADNSFGGALPTFWGSKGYWPALQLLSLQGNQLTGGLPATWAASSAFPAMRGGSGADGVCVTHLCSFPYTRADSTLICCVGKG